MNMATKNYDQILERVAKNIKQARAKAGLAQEDMRDHGFSIRHYQKLESGKYWPTFYTLVRVADALGAQIKDLVK